jgi:nucleoside-diphosphate-sugar epimerase
MTSKPLSYAVLGGSGFIGRTLCATLLERGHQVLAVARRPASAVDGLRWITLDLATADPADFATALRDADVDVVVNAAGGMWGLSDEEMVDANVTLMRRLIEALAQVPSRPRLINIGTVHEYGLTPIGASMAEDAVPAPVMAYGRLKLQCTELVSAAVRDGRIDGLSLRVGNVIGPGQPGHSLLGIVAAKLAEAQRAGLPAELTFGPLRSQRDFIGLDDVVRAIIAAAALPKVEETVINVGRGVAASAREMVDLLIEVSGVPATLAEGPAQQPETDWQQLDIDRAARVLGWRPAPDLADELRRLWLVARASS